MKNSNSHLYLYAKGWYHKTNTINDLKIIVGHRAGINVEHISTDDVIHVLLGVAIKHMNNDRVCRCIIDMMPFSQWSRFFTKKQEVYTEEEVYNLVITSLLRVLFEVTVRDGNKYLIELDPPDPNILPIHKNGENVWMQDN